LSSRPPWLVLIPPLAGEISKEIGSALPSAARSAKSARSPCSVPTCTRSRRTADHAVRQAEVVLPLSEHRGASSSRPVRVALRHTRGSGQTAAFEAGYVLYC